MRQARIARTRRRGPPDPERDARGERQATRLAALPAVRLAAGPGLVAAAFDITRADTGRDLLEIGASLRLERGTVPSSVIASPRVGIGSAAEPWRGKPWRLIDPSSPAVSGPRAAVTGPRPRA